MEIKRLAATFGKLEQEQLELSPGLNLIEAPNESGKSTWTAFLRVMLYGLNTRDRSPNADKRRYLPWSGSAMEGVLEAATDLGDITLLRRTARAKAPPIFPTPIKPNFSPGRVTALSMSRSPLCPSV